MRPRISSFSRVSLLSVAIFATTNQRLPVTAELRVPASTVEIASTHFMTEVRLRKLHLARPDLIPYPIETEVYC